MFDKSYLLATALNGGLFHLILPSRWSFRDSQRKRGFTRTEHMLEPYCNGRFGLKRTDATLCDREFSSEELAPATHKNARVIPEVRFRVEP